LLGNSRYTVTLIESQALTHFRAVTLAVTLRYISLHLRITAGGRKRKLGKQKAESRVRRSEVRGQRSEVRGQRPGLISAFSFQHFSFCLSAFRFPHFSFFPSLTTYPRQTREMPLESQRRRRDIFVAPRIQNPSPVAGGIIGSSSWTIGFGFAHNCLRCFDSMASSAIPGAGPTYFT
jgi:hypothetical protein